MNTFHAPKKGTHSYTRNASGNLRKQFSSLFDTLKSSRKILLLMVIVAIASIAVSSLISVMLSRISNHYLPSLGVIKTIEVETYWDAACTNKREIMDWGEIEPGKSINTTLYVKSVSNFKVYLNLKLTDWTPPEISDYITITWDYNGTRLNPGESIPVTLNLSTSSSKDFVYYLVDNEITNFDVAVHFIASE